MMNTLDTAAYSMRPIERYFQRIYLQHPDRNLDQPCKKNEIADLLTDADQYRDEVAGGTDFIKDLDEEDFFEESLDVAFYIHFRYMPCFLHSHVFFEMMYVQSGSCINYIGGVPYSLTEGDICILAPGITHAVGAYDEDTILINALIRSSTFDSTFMGLMEEDGIISNFFREAIYKSEGSPCLLFHTHSDPEIPRYLAMGLKELDENRRYKKQMINNLLSTLFISLIRNHEKDMEIPSKDIHAGKDDLLYIIHYMQNHYNTITLKELAAFFNYSERQLQRILRNATGKSFMENIQEQRIEKAKELLTETSLSIEEISTRTGFHADNNFRRIFKRCCGVNPGEYRTQNRQKL